ncbi:MAG: murein L,D-transpeptidase [Thalassobius sp.]|nr:murein L,D-transpeptidase [Thalassovita sp.]
MFKLNYAVKAFIILFTFSINLINQVQAQDDEISFEIKRLVESLVEKNSLDIEGVTIYSKTVLPIYYQNRNYKHGWTNSSSTEEALKSIGRAGEEGLTPEDYHYDLLLNLRKELTENSNPSASSIAHFDLLLTDAVLLYSRHLLNGKVNPVKIESTWNIQRKVFSGDSLAVLEDGIANNKIPQLLESIKPDHPLYKGLKKHLAHYRLLAKKGGWQTIDAGPTLKPGMEDARILQVRKRLALEGFLPDMGIKIPYTNFFVNDSLIGEEPENEKIYDRELATAIARFQMAYSLEVDSAIGQMTLDALNIPIEDRIDQIRVNLERARWVLGTLGDDYVLVNIAGFELFLVRNGKEIWKTNVVVGKKYSQTPVFKDRIQFIVFNPTWTVPPGIMSSETLPRMKKDGNYLSSHDLEMVDNKGNALSQSILNETQYTLRTFPYQVRQRPGDNNALGRVKFMFPNKYSIYLHDTPSKSYFSKTSRAYSHGCVRVESPLKLAEIILNDPVNYSAEKIQKIIKTNQTTTVNLKNKLDVLLLYWTAEIHPSGKLYFKEDVYNRDKKVLTELDEKRPRI